MNFDHQFHQKLAQEFIKCRSYPEFRDGKETPCYYINKAFKVSSRILEDIIYLESMKTKTIRDITMLS